MGLCSVGGDAAEPRARRPVQPGSGGPGMCQAAAPCLTIPLQICSAQAGIRSQQTIFCLSSALMKRQRTLPVNNSEDDGVCGGPVYSTWCSPGSAPPHSEFPKSAGSPVPPASVFLQRELLCARQARTGGRHACCGVCPRGRDSSGESRLPLHPGTEEGFSRAGSHRCLLPYPAAAPDLRPG